MSAARVTLERFVDVIATTPARIVGLFLRKGTIAIGSDADLVLVDPARRETIRATELLCRAGHVPLDGLACVDWPVLTISRERPSPRRDDRLDNRAAASTCEADVSTVRNEKRPPLTAASPDSSRECVSPSRPLP